MNINNYFKQLRSIKQKQIITEHLLSNIINNVLNDSIPKGLEIKIMQQTPGK